MSKNTNLSFLTDYITADITNGRIGINNASPTVAFDVVGASKFTGSSTFSSTVGIGTTSPNASWGATIANSTLYSSNALRLERNGIPTQGMNISAGGENVTFNAFNTASDGLNSAFVWTSTAFNTTTERMRITSAGNVGIGISTPLDTYTGRTVLTINNNGAFGAFLNFGYNGTLYAAMESNTTELRISNYQNIPTIFYTNTAERMRITSAGYLLLGTTSSYFGQAGRSDFEMNASTDNMFVQKIGDVLMNYIYSSSSQTEFYSLNKLRLSGGNVLINTSTDNGYRLNLNGQPGANGYTLWTNYSDRRLKENIQPLVNTTILDKINSLNPVTFNYNEASGYDEETRARKVSGFIAQELKEIFPEMVGTLKLNDEEYLDTNLSNLSLYLVKAIQELSTEINLLKQK